MVDADRRQVLQGLKAGRDALYAAVAGIDGNLALRKPGPARWSILECVEHVALAERFLLSRLTGAVDSGQSHGSQAREAAIVQRGLDRARRVESPEPGRPRGCFQDLAEALSAFDSARTGTIGFVERFAGDPRSWLTNHPLIPGPVNCYEMLLIVSVHPARHAAQIAETRAALEAASAGTEG
jgi:hypothetical protein